MTYLKIDAKKLSAFISNSEIESLQNDLINKQKLLNEKTSVGNDFLGWITLPSTISENHISKIIRCAEKINQQSEVLVVIGIGGSYLGARAVIDALNNSFSCYNNETQIVYAGNNINDDYHADLLKLLDKKSYSLAVISKSGTTTEPAIAFRLLKNHLEKKYGKDKAKERIIAITDKANGALKNLATSEGYEAFDIPDDVGGRYSVLTPVGLLPIAIAKKNIRKIIAGALNMQNLCTLSSDVFENPAMHYAAIRNILLSKGKTIEILANFQPQLQYFTEWWKQLYGESEGKNGLGIFPAGVTFTTDLHSMGQYIQDGKRNIFETILSVEKSKRPIQIPFDEANIDGLNFLAGKSMHEVNSFAETATSLAHTDGGVPVIRISIPEVCEETIGELIYFFEYACGLSGYLSGVNPFNQPGVEAYKKNMFALLDKPGFEKLSKEIKERLK